MAKKLVRRGGTYTLRVHIPKHLQAHMLGKDGKPRKEISLALGTADPKTANRLAPLKQAEWNKKFEELEAMHPIRPLSEGELQHAIWERYNELLRADEQRRLALPDETDLDDIWRQLETDFGEDSIAAFRIHEDIAGMADDDAKTRAARHASLKTELAKGNTKAVQPTLLETVKSRKLAIQPRSKEERQLAHGLQRAEISALQIMAARDVGNYGAAPTDPIIKPPAATLPTIAAPGETIMELFGLYESENPGQVRPETLKQSRTVVDLFSQFVGRHFPARNITKKEIREWKTALKSFPVKAFETKCFKGMDFRQIVAANARFGKSPISAKTLNRYLAAVGAFSRWLVAQGYLDTFPTHGMMLAVDKKKKKVFPYSIEELNTLFRSPIYTGCLSLDTVRKAAKPGNIVPKDHHFWLPLMALYSGARINELAQLLTTDIVQSKENWLFNISDEGNEEQSLKTANSKRIVPIHQMLIDLGFLQYVQVRKLAGDTWLFPTLLADNRGRRSARYADFYRAYISKLGVKVDRKLNFHSFRHTYVDALRNAGFLDSDIGLIIGHEQSSMTANYGILKHGDVARRVKIVSALAYEGLDLSHLLLAK